LETKKSRKDLTYGFLNLYDKYRVAALNPLHRGFKVKPPKYFMLRHHVCIVFLKG